MEYNPNAVKAGVGLMASIGLGLGLLLYFLIDGFNSGKQEEFEDFVHIGIGIIATILAIMFCPIVASIVGAIISKDFDDEGDASFNGAITGAAGTFLIVMIVSFVISGAVEESNSDINEDDMPSTNDLVIKGALASAISGALGAYIGFKYLWSQMPASESKTPFSLPKEPPKV
jgi:hypothetical protein